MLMYGSQATSRPTYIDESDSYWLLLIRFLAMIASNQPRFKSCVICVRLVPSSGPSIARIRRPASPTSFSKLLHCWQGQPCFQCPSPRPLIWNAFHRGLHTGSAGDYVCTWKLKGGLKEDLSSDAFVSKYLAFTIQPQWKSQALRRSKSPRALNL
jgi:hypothetical protein